MLRQCCTVHLTLGFRLRDILLLLGDCRELSWAHGAKHRVDLKNGHSDEANTMGQETEEKEQGGGAGGDESLMHS